MLTAVWQKQQLNMVQGDVGKGKPREDVMFIPPVPPPPPQPKPPAPPARLPNVERIEQLPPAPRPFAGLNLRDKSVEQSLVDLEEAHPFFNHFDVKYVLDEWAIQNGRTGMEPRDIMAQVPTAQTYYNRGLQNTRDFPDESVRNPGPARQFFENIRAQLPAGELTADDLNAYLWRTAKGDERVYQQLLQRAAHVYPDLIPKLQRPDRSLADRIVTSITDFIANAPMILIPPASTSIYEVGRNSGYQPGPITNEMMWKPPPTLNTPYVNPAPPARAPQGEFTLSTEPPYIAPGEMGRAGFLISPQLPGTPVSTAPVTEERRSEEPATPPSVYDLIRQEYAPPEPTQEQVELFAPPPPVPPPVEVRTEPPLRPDIREEQQPRAEPAPVQPTYVPPDVREEQQPPAPAQVPEPLPAYVPPDIREEQQPAVAPVVTAPATGVARNQELVAPPSNTENERLLLEQQAEQQRLAQEQAVREQAAREAEQQAQEQARLQQLAEQQRLAQEEVVRQEQVRQAEEQARLRQLVEQQRLAQEAEQQRLAQEEAARQVAEQAQLRQLVEQQRVAQERAAQEEAVRQAEAARQAEQARNQEPVYAPPPPPPPPPAPETVYVPPPEPQPSVYDLIRQEYEPPAPSPEPVWSAPAWSPPEPSYSAPEPSWGGQSAWDIYEI